MKRQPGRPALDATEPSVGVHVRMPLPLYNETYARAQHRRVSIAQVIRDALRSTALLELKNPK